ncbi:hypothetical protein BAE44_0012650, partial [Dichanthelium oligosanthes]
LLLLLVRGNQPSHPNSPLLSIRHAHNTLLRAGYFLSRQQCPLPLPRGGPA